MASLPMKPICLHLENGPIPMDIDESSTENPAPANDHAPHTEGTVEPAAAATSATNGHIIRNMLQTVLSSINALDNSQTAADGTPSPTSDTASNRPASPPGARASPNARLAELLQSLQAQHGGPEEASVVDTGTPSLTSLLRNLRTRALGRNAFAGHAEQTGGPATAALPGNDPRRSPVPVLILIGGGTMRGLRSGRAATASQAASSSAPGSEDPATNSSTSASLLPEQNPAPSEADAAADASISQPTPAAASTAGGPEAPPLRRRSINFMIYFIPAAGGIGTSAANNTSAPGAAVAQQPPQPPSNAPPSSNASAPAPASMDVPLTNILGNLPNLENPLQPAAQTTGGPAAEGHPPSSPFTHGTPINLFGGAPGVTHSGSLGNIPLTGTRALEEEVAIAVVLQIVSNLLREGSMNGPGGLLGGTLSLDVDLSSGEGGPAGTGESGHGGAGGAGNATYEDFLRLAEMLGPARPRHAAAADVDRELPIIKFKGSQEESSVDAMEVDEHTEEDEGAAEKKSENKSDTLKNKVAWHMEDLVPATREKCMICLSMYETGDDVRVMRCRHGFHKGCLDQWLTQYVNSCPLCRDKAVSPAASSEGTTATEASASPSSAEGQPGSAPTTVPGERRGLLRRVWEMFGPGRASAAATDSSTVGASTAAAAGQSSAIPVPNGRNLPAAVVVLLG
ncbi:hypothetical protein HDU86_001755 [Geranomyces michiganensis]|nr:hypothetical protein HDU86_001755 [Geranomyces michiganensis]